LGDDDVLPKEFLEGLMELANRIERGEEKVYPIDEVMGRVKELVKDIEVDLNEKLEED
jgi:hypothetical protein